MVRFTRDKWLNHQFSSGSYTGDDYLKFQRDCKSDLNKMAKDNGLIGEFAKKLARTI